MFYYAGTQPERPIDRITRLTRWQTVLWHLYDYGLFGAVFPQNRNSFGPGGILDRV